MEGFVNFIIEHYIIFDIIGVFLILALIGYFVSIKKEKAKVFKLNDETMNIANDIPINANVSLRDYVNENKSINNNNNNNL